jgi:hypothetical protein
MRKEQLEWRVGLLLPAYLLDATGVDSCTIRKHESIDLGLKLVKR